MKKQFVIILLLLLTGFFASQATAPGKSFGLLVNDRLLHPGVDSLPISAKGTLTLHALTGETPQAGRVKFKVLIRHRIFAGKLLLFPWNETYMAGETLNAIDVSKILLRTQPGDQLLIVPAGGGGESLFETLLVTISGGGC